jgi:cytochrome c oxidase subunit III
MMSTVQRNTRLHPQKLMMFMAMGSMFMVFAGLTSAFLLQKSKYKLSLFSLPFAFWISTVLIIVSSYTMHKAVIYFKERNMTKYRNYIVFTIILGLGFIFCQLTGFSSLYSQHITLQGNASAGFLYVIAGLHILHLVGAIVALIIVYIMAFRKKVKIYSAIGHENMALFWHFVDFLWIYLFIFFLVNFKL